MMPIRFGEILTAPSRVGAKSRGLETIIKLCPMFLVYLEDSTTYGQVGLYYGKQLGSQVRSIICLNLS